MRLILWLVITLLMAACATQSQSIGTSTLDINPTSLENAAPSTETQTADIPVTATASPSATSTVNPVVTEPEQEPTTQIPPTNVVTPEVIPPDVLMTPDQNRYSLAVSYSLDSDFPDTYPNPPAGNKWVVVVATLTNVSASPMTVERNDITLITESGEVYPPELPDDFTNPPIVGTSIDANTSYLGLIRFAVSQDEQAVSLAWCLNDDNGDCANKVTASIP